VTEVGVLAHSAKTLGGGLEELRKTLATNGISDPLWCEVPKSRFVPEQVEELLKEGVELISSATSAISSAGSPCSLTPARRRSLEPRCGRGVRSDGLGPNAGPLGDRRRRGVPFVETTIGRTFDIRLDKAVPYEIDGGVRKKTKRLKCKVVPGAITVRVPREEGR
jgi:hypothetical protein